VEEKTLPTGKADILEPSQPERGKLQTKGEADNIFRSQQSEP